MKARMSRTNVIPILFALMAATEVKWTLRTWLNNFMTAPRPIQHDHETHDRLAEDDETDLYGSYHREGGAASAGSLGDSPDDELYDDLGNISMDGVILLALAATLAALIYYRNQQVELRQRQRNPRPDHHT